MKWSYYMRVCVCVCACVTGHRPRDILGSFTRVCLFHTSRLVISFCCLTFEIFFYSCTCLSFFYTLSNFNRFIWWLCIFATLLPRDLTSRASISLSRCCKTGRFASSAKNKITKRRLWVLQRVSGNRPLSMSPFAPLSRVPRPSLALVEAIGDA